MSQKYNLDDILKAVDSINPKRLSEKRFAKEEILDAINQISTPSNETKIIKTDFNKTSNDINNNVIKPKHALKNKKPTQYFTKPLLLTNIIKYESTNSKVLFLKKLYNSNLKIITMKAPGVNK
jgi:hypothetical protein